MQTTFDLAAFSSTMLLYLDLNTGPALMFKNVFIDTQLNNEMRVYEDSVIVKEISKLVAEYSSI